ncbi:MAG: protein kinase [Deltaproteobacteria bacterium]|nr:protein kinase [Deltaproteobacteria bacterium]
MSDGDPHDRTGLFGRRLGEFVVREPLSAGGFGAVYRAEQPALAREAVIKILHRRLRVTTLIQRFLREARLASRLDHPYAAHVYAFGVEPDGLPWIAMELVRGTPLDRLLAASGPIALERFVPLLERICQVVQTAHDQGIVHRDLKPANVMVLVRAGQLLPKLLDLGIARLADDPADELAPATPATLDGGGSPADTAVAADGATVGQEAASSGDGRLTEAGAVIGSPQYMAPEQWIDARAADQRTDLYALGVLAYEALTGRPPFVGATRLELAMAHAGQAPPPLGGDLPLALDAVLARTLAKRADERYPSALALAAAFRAASGISEPTAGLPRLAEDVRMRALAHAPQPLAQAVALLDAARNPHHARDAVWQVVRVATRLLGMIALAAHAHVRGDARAATADAVRQLRRRTTSEGEWLALARELTAPFAAVRAAYPVPELIDYVEQPRTALTELIALRDEDDATAAPQVQALVARALALVERLLAELEPLGAYAWVVPTAHGHARWMGLARGAAIQPAGRAALALDQPVLVDASGIPAVTLWPFVQVHEPAPGAAPHLFLLEGRGRHGARLVASPDAYELEDDGLWEFVGGLAEGDLATSAPEVAPYPGLAAFTADDGARFFGRERDALAVCNRLRSQALVVVVGPSGIGKSSFVQAGVVPNLPADWRVITLRPGPAPMASLRARLEPVLGTGTDAALADPGALAAALRSRPGTTVLVVDQLEELFTLCADPRERARVVALLVDAARSADDHVRVVMTLRDDFLLHAEGLPALRSRLAPALQLLTTPSRDDLLRILREPLRLVGYELDDPALADEMVDALADARSPLALLSFTAARLWALRDRRFRQLTRKAYASLGGVGGALAQHAEATLAAMLPEQQRLVREVFRRAVTSDGTRAVLPRSELDQVLGGDAHAAAVVHALVDARLLVTAEGIDGRDTIELTHEALIDAWPRLVRWRREDAEGARLRDQLRAAARQWEDRGRSPGLLWRGDALAEYRLWKARYPGALTELEQAFAAASLADDVRGRRRRTLAAVIAITVLAAGVVALVILNAGVASERARAEASAAEAVRAAASLRTTLRAQYEDQGRRLVLDGDAPQGLAYLMKAQDMGVAGPAHELLVASAAAMLRNRIAQLGHGDQVNRARFSPDGAWVVTVSQDQHARVWDASTWRLVSDLPHDAAVSRADIGPGGKTIITATENGKVTVWERASGRELRHFTAGHQPLSGALFSPDGTLVATVAADDIVELWDPATGARRAALWSIPHVPKPQWGTPLAFSADGARVAAGGVDGTLRIWDIATGRLLSQNGDHRDLLSAVRFSPDGTSVLVASADGTASLVDAATGARRQRFEHRLYVEDAEFSPDGALIATASKDRTARIWNTTTGQLVRAIEGHTATVNAVAFSPDGRTLATGADDRTAALWSVATGLRLARLVGHGDAVLDVQFDPTGARLVTASTDLTAIVWTAVPQQSVVPLVGHVGVVRAGAFSPDGARVVTEGADGTVRVWDRATGRQLQVMHQSGYVLRAQFSPDGRQLASVGTDRIVHIWDSRTGAELRALRGHDDAIRDVAWSPDGTAVATAGMDGTARIWPVTGADPPLIYRGHGDGRVYSVAYAPRGDRIVTTGSDNTGRVWNPRDGRDVVVWTEGKGISDGTFDPGGTSVATTTWQASARIYRADTGAMTAELLGHESSVLSTAWSPGGDFVATAAIDATARIWDARRGDALIVFREPQLRTLWYAGFDPSGQAVLTTGADGAAAIWAMPPQANDLASLTRCQVTYAWSSDHMVHVDPPDACVVRN